jgi:plastocyanin
MRKKAFLIPALVLLALALASCGGDDGDTTVTETSPPATEEEPTTESGQASEPGGAAPAGGNLERSAKVEIVEFTYDPDPVRVQAGGKVIWQNMDSAPHTATADDGSFDTGILEEGKLKSESFKDPGTFTYFCTVHPDMHGTVEVVEAE